MVWIVTRFTGTFETTYPGYQRFAYSMEHTRTARGIKTTASIETPIRGYEKFGGNVEYTQGERNGFRVGSQITTPIQVNRQITTLSQVTMIIPWKGSQG